jgi:hypothetical protein
MNWEAIGAIGQMFGSVAVLVTLGYLAVQVQYARREILRSTRQARTEANRELMLNWANNPQLLRIYMKLGMPAPAWAMKRAEIGQDEALQVQFDLWAWWLSRAQTIEYIDQLSPDERDEFHATTRLLYREGAISRLWLDENKPLLNRKAVRYVENLLARPG